MLLISPPDIQKPPASFLPFFQSEDLEKLQVTIRKIAAYLEKAGADEWWLSWLDKAFKCTSLQMEEPSGMLKQ